MASIRDEVPLMPRVCPKKRTERVLF